MRLEKPDILAILNALRENTFITPSGEFEFRFRQDRVPKWLEVEGGKVLIGPNFDS